MGGRSPRLQRRVGSLTSEEVISSFNYTVSNFDNEESDNRAAWVRRWGDSIFLALVSRAQEVTSHHSLYLQTVSYLSYHQSLKYFVLLENSNLGSKLRRLSRFLRLRRKRRSRWRQDLIKIKRAEARIMTMRTSSGGPRVPRVTSP